MKRILPFKIFEALEHDLFDVPLFSPVNDQEDEIISDFTHEILKKFEGNYFQMDEPSTGFGNWDNSNELRADYWLTVETVDNLHIATPKEVKILEEHVPDRQIEYKDWKTGESKFRTFPENFGTFFWYSVPKDPNRRRGDRQGRIWMVVKDGWGEFRAFDDEYNSGITRNTKLREAFEKAKPHKDLKALLETQRTHLNAIGKYFEPHLDAEVDAWESEAADNADEPWYPSPPF